MISLKLAVLFFFCLLAIVKTEDNDIEKGEEAIEKGFANGLDLIKKIWANEKLRNDLVDIGIVFEDSVTKEVSCFATDAQSFDATAKALLDQIIAIFAKYTDPKTNNPLFFHGLKELLSDETLVKNIGENQQFMKAVEHAAECYINNMKESEGAFDKFTKDMVDLEKNGAANELPPPIPLLRLRQF